MSRSIVGARIRERRRSLGITQVDLARRIGVSASYLNLIERNKRGIAGALLKRVSDELGIRVEELDGATERRLYDQLREIGADPRLAGLRVEVEGAGELIGRFPGWARAIATLARSERFHADLVRVMSDRLTHDPYLREAVHRMLTHTAALRSAAEILTDIEDLELERRARFETILVEESRRLSDVGSGLAAYFDRVHTMRQSVAPDDEIDALFERRSNRFEEIEDAVRDVAVAPAPRNPAILRELAIRAAGGVIGRILDEAPEIETENARTRSLAKLLRYAADAIALPEAAFPGAAAAAGYDVEVLGDRLGEPVDRVCRRLAALPRDAGHPRFGYVAANASGVVTEYFGIPGLAAARHGEACPLWINYRAPAWPGRTLRQRAVFPTGLTFIFVARARRVGEPGFGRPELHETDLLALDERDARRTVYGDSRNGEMSTEEVGTSCRICPREACTHRAGLDRIG